MTFMRQLEPWLQRLVMEQCDKFRLKGWNKSDIVRFWRSKGLAFTHRHLSDAAQPDAFEHWRKNVKRLGASNARPISTRRR